MYKAEADIQTEPNWFRKMNAYNVPNQPRTEPQEKKRRARGSE